MLVPRIIVVAARPSSALGHPLWLALTPPVRGGGFAFLDFTPKDFSQGGAQGVPAAENGAVTLHGCLHVYGPCGWTVASATLALKAN